MNDAFDEWVAKTIFSISGIWPEHLCAFPRECALTLDAGRMVSRQGGFEEYFDPVDLGNMRISARVLTHFRLPIKKLH
jgi:hypothetical protein